MCKGARISQNLCSESGGEFSCILGSSAADSPKGVQWPRATVCKQKNVQRSTLFVRRSTADDLFCQQVPLEGASPSQGYDVPRSGGTQEWQGLIN